MVISQLIKRSIRIFNITYDIDRESVFQTRNLNSCP